MGKTRNKRHTHRHNNYKQNGGKTKEKTPTNIIIISRMGETRRKRHTHRHNNYKQNGRNTKEKTHPQT